MKERIVYQSGDYYVLKTPRAMEVYRNGRTDATKVATISATDALQRAIDWIRRARAISEVSGA